MTFSQVKEYFRQRPWLVFFIIISVVIIISLILRSYIVSTQPLPNIPKPKLNSIVPVSLTNVTVELPDKLPQIPDTLTVRKALPVKLTPNTFLKLFQSPDQVTPNIWNDSVGGLGLSFEPYAKKFTFTDENFPGDVDPALFEVVDLTRATKSASDFIHEQLGISDYQPILNQVRYDLKQQSADIKSDPSPEEASLVIIPFAFTIDGVPAYTGNSVQLPISVWVDSTDKVVRVDAYETLFTVSSQRAIKTLDVTNAVQEAKTKNLISLIRLTTDGEGGFDVTRLTHVKVNTLQLEYRYIEDSGLVIPMYHIQGLFTMEGREDKLEADFAIPAVPTAP